MVPQSECVAYTQSPSFSFLGKYTWVRYWKSKEESDWISAFTFILHMSSNSYRKWG